MGVRRLVVVAVAIGLLAMLPPAASAAPTRKPAPCSRGLVALTFDDGPSASVTPRLTRLLQREQVPATFFMIGQHVAAHPELARMVERRGFTIGNHTWDHTDITTQTPAQLRRALHATHTALAEAGVHPTRLMRPPYGAIDDRARTVLSRMGLTPVLWTIDSRDWAGKSSSQIRASIVGAVRPHRVNLVLQHDGVANSPATLRALPGEIRALRAQGYCFAALDSAGEPTPPVPVATVTADRRRVTEGDRVRLTVRLDRPTSRPTTARLALGGTATSPSDVGLTDSLVRFPVGSQVARVWLRTRPDAIDEPTEEVTVKVYAGRGIRPAGVAQALVRIRDDDPPPVASLVDSTATASPLIRARATVRVRLDRPSDRDVTVVALSDLGPATVVVPAGSRRAELGFYLPVGERRDEVRSVAVRIRSVTHGGQGTDATLTVRPPERSRAEAIREVAASARWPKVRLRALF